MSKDKCFILGANAYRNGIERLPLLEPKFYPLSNITADDMKHWLEGWDAANLEDTEWAIYEQEQIAKAEAYNEHVLTYGPWRPDPEAEQEEARERWLEDLNYKWKNKFKD